MPTGASLHLIGLTPRAARLDRIETEHDQASALTWRTDDHGLLDALTRSILSITSASRVWRPKLRDRPLRPPWPRPGRVPRARAGAARPLRSVAGYSKRR